MICGFTSLPDASGAVSTWAMKPIAGAVVSQLAGMLAITYPYSSNAASTPIARSSSRSIFRRLSSFAALGCESDSGSDCVSTDTYLKNLSKIFSIKYRDVYLIVFQLFKGSCLLHSGSRHEPLICCAPEVYVPPI